MEKTKLFRKNDMILVLVLLSLAAAGLFVFHLTHMGEGRKVRVTVDGVLFGEYALGTSGAGTDRSEDGDSLPEFDAVVGGQGTYGMKDVSENGTKGAANDSQGTDDLSGKKNIQRIEIPGKVGKCILVISDGKADMESADCPNQICVHHSAISHTGETIVCLPNRVVIEVVD
ncbi:MAG: NusG domain II-containing protein [Lachnospiraceae bacterium]|nr:NusG domain II-containing protein [Lachnospiraceae bacterium]